MTASATPFDRELIAQALGVSPSVVADHDVEVRRYESDAVVAVEGVIDDTAYVVLAGSLRMVTTDPRHRLVTIARYERGALVGEQVCFQQSPRRDVRIVAANPCTVAAIPGRIVRAWAAEGRARGDLAVRGRREALRQLQSLSATGAQIAALLEDAEGIFTREVTAGDVLFAEGERADFAYLVLAGRFEALKWDHGGARVLGASGPGTFVGELGVLEDAPRAATVRALEPSTVLVLSAALTRRLCQATGVAALASALRAAYALAGRGIAYSVLVPGDEEDQVVTTIQLADGRSVTVGRTLTSQMVLARATIAPEVTLASPDGRVHIGMAGGRPVLIEGPQGWGDLPQMMERLLSGQPLEAWRQAAFEANGNLLFTRDAELAAEAIACACTGISVATIRGHAAAGATTLEAVERVCGAGGVCGGCRNRLSTLLGRENFALCRATVTPLGAGVVRMLLHPVGGELPAIAPGQHVTIDGLIDGVWVSRSYTVVEGRADRIECAIKIEPHGVFSTWLAAHGDGALMRVSSAQGEPITATGEPLLCLVAGIGVTPAVAALRAVAGRRPLHVAYLYRGRSGAAYLDELEAAAAVGQIGFTGHDTTVDGRPDLEAFTAAALTASGARSALVCGPVAWATEVTARLRAHGLAVRTDVFVPAGSDGGPPMVCPGAWRDQTKPPRPPSWRQFTVAEPGTPEAEARAYLEQFFTEQGASGGFASRWREVQKEIEDTGTYRQTIEEITFGARLAWRNAARCIGRLYWSGLKVRDARHLVHPDDIAQALFEHLDLAYNNGNLTPLMTVFDPGTRERPTVRLWNPQLLRYAAYRKSTGQVIGDPAQLALTGAIERLGWRGGGGRFDLLPLVIAVDGQPPRYYEIPAAQRREVRIRHPKYPGIEELGLQWYTVPAVSDMALDCGGVLYRGAPFNGWYMGTEIGARNFTDVARYNLSLQIAEKIGADTRRESTLWRDKALIAMTEAVLWSFEADGVKIADHFSASIEFLQFCRNEQAAGREVRGHWPWLVPPISGSATPLFLDQWTDGEVKPALVMQAPAYAAPAGVG